MRVLCVPFSRLRDPGAAVLRLRRERDLPAAGRRPRLPRGEAHLRVRLRRREGHRGRHYLLHVQVQLHWTLL